MVCIPPHLHHYQFIQNFSEAIGVFFLLFCFLLWVEVGCPPVVLVERLLGQSSGFESPV